MVDSKTTDAYAQDAGEFSREWLEQPVPTDVYGLLETYFRRGGKTIDVGCGNGRDTNWLHQNGFPAVGVDAVENLLAEAARLYPEVPFYRAVLPELNEVSEQFENVFCETVIMHLAIADIGKAVKRIRSLALPGGVVYLSWRVTQGADVRDAKGRLYTAFEPQMVLDCFTQDRVLFFEDRVSVGSGKRVCRVVVRVG